MTAGMVSTTVALPLLFVFRIAFRLVSPTRHMSRARSRSHGGVGRNRLLDGADETGSPILAERLPPARMLATVNRQNDNLVECLAEVHGMSHASR